MRPDLPKDQRTDAEQTFKTIKDDAVEALKVQQDSRLVELQTQQQDLRDNYGASAKRIGRDSGSTRLIRGRPGARPGSLIGKSRSRARRNPAVRVLLSRLSDRLSAEARRTVTVPPNWLAVHA